jgi:hypothetical protein
MTDSHGHFVWYELLTTDMAAAKAFYAKVVGWSAHDASTPGMAYTLLSVGESVLGGVMILPEAARRTGAQPRWLGYVAVDDVEAAVVRLRQLGGAVHIPPADIPGIGRFAVVADPQSATLALIKPAEPAQAPAGELDRPGRVGWHELLAATGETAFPFYGALFAWRKGEPEVEATGIYQPFFAGTEIIGGMFTKPKFVAIPFWLYYFNVGDMAAAVENVHAGGGKVLEGPVDMPGGSRVARCEDPQGAMFALMEKPKDKAIGYFARGASTGASPGATGGRRWSW